MSDASLLPRRRGAPREEGWYKVMIGDRLACLYWSGTDWQIPRRVYPRKTLPAGAVATTRPLEWSDEDG